MDTVRQYRNLLAQLLNKAHELKDEKMIKTIKEAITVAMEDDDEEEKLTRMRY